MIPDTITLLIYPIKEITTLKGHSKLLHLAFNQNINRPNAKVTGFEISSHLELSYLAKFLNGFSLSYKYSQQKGRMDGNIPMNPIQPKTAIYGISYAHPDEKFGLDLYVSHVSAKKCGRYL